MNTKRRTFWFGSSEVSVTMNMGKYHFRPICAPLKLALRVATPFPPLFGIQTPVELISGLDYGHHYVLSYEKDQ